MSITRNDPNTVFLGGDRTQINDMAAKAAITPGHLIERVNTAGVTRWQKHSTAGADISQVVATEQAMMNKGVDDDYAIGDLVEASALHKGATAWLLVASGQTLVYGDGLESAGDGTVRKLASGTRLFTALEAKTTTALTRIRAEVK